MIFHPLVFSNRFPVVVLSLLIEKSYRELQCNQLQVVCLLHKNQLSCWFVSKDAIVSNSPLTLPVCFFIKVVSNLLCEPLTSPKRSTNDCNLAWKIRASCIGGRRLEIG